jgi:hypothetical protein
MSQRVSEVLTSPSMMTFREYYMSFIGIRDPHLANGWGWFVDIELNSEPIRIQRYKKSSQFVSIPNTIKEYPSIRSMKSMKNLHDTSMIFEMDDIDETKHRTNNVITMITHTIGLIGVIICYYFTCGNS